MTVKIYLGNHTNDEVELDDDDMVMVHPIAVSIGGVWDIKGRNAFRVEYWDGLNRTQKYFHYDEDSKAKLKDKADAFYKEHNKNTKDRVIEVKAKDINEFVMKNFRFVQTETYFMEQDIPLPAKLVGQWLDNEKISIRDIAKSFKLNMNVVRSSLEELGILEEKDIPQLYMQNTKQVRLNLLAGLIESYQAKDIYRIEIYQKSYDFALKIIELIKSLGIFATMNEKIRKEETKVYTYYRIVMYPRTVTIPVSWACTEATEERQMKGVKISKTQKASRHTWTQQMKDTLWESIHDTNYKLGDRINWTKVKADHTCFHEITVDALKNAYKALKKKTT